MRTINCDEILPRGEFKNLNDKDYEIQVIRFCTEKFNEFKNNIANLKESVAIEEPKREYEIFRLNVENPRIFLLNTNEIDYSGDEEDKEVYYTTSAASKICVNKKRLNEDATIGDLEIEASFIEEKEKIEEEIEELKEADDNQYSEDKFIYNCIDGTIILDEYNKISSLKSGLEEENKLLKEKLKNQESTIIDLSNKLKISLQNIESSREKLDIKAKSKFEVLLERLKEILD